MRVEIQPSGNLTKSDLKKLDKLKQGDVIKGTIIEVNGNVAKIDIGNGEVAYGKLEIPLSLLKDKNLKFVIKDIKESILLLSPVYEDIDFNKEFILKNKDLIMDRILNLNNLTKDDINLNILKEMIGFRMSLSSENIGSITKHVDKLLSILNLQEDEIIQALSTIKEPFDEDVNKLIKTRGEVESKGVNLNETVIKESLNNSTQLEKKVSLDTKGSIEIESKGGKVMEKIQVGKEDIFYENQNKETNIIKNIKTGSTVDISKILVETNNVFDEKNKDFLKLDEIVKQSLEEKSEIKFKNITEQVKEELKNIFSQDNLIKNNTIESIIQKVAFLTKSGIDISINNLDRLTRLVEKGETLNKELEEVVKIALRDGVINDKDREEILSKTKSLNIKFDHNDSVRIKEFYKELSDTIEKLLTNISSKGKISEELNLKTKDLNNNIDFLNKINDKSTMMLIPFNLNNKDIENKLYILSKRKIAKKSDNMKVYISLNTNNLENVKILCDFTYDRLNVNFKVEKEYLNFFEANIGRLKNSLQSKGYENIFIYTNNHEEENILDLVSYENSINYMLNVKV